MKVELIDNMGNDLSVIRAATASFAKDPVEWDEKKHPRLINYLARGMAQAEFKELVESLEHIPSHINGWKAREKFVENALEQYRHTPTHFCYDDKTEIITPSGWKLFSDLTDDDLVGQVDYSQETMVLSWVKPSHIVREPFNGNLLACKGTTIDYAVTPNHRMLLKPRTSSGWKPFEVRTALEVHNKDFKVSTTARLAQQGIGSYQEGLLYGFLLADGFVSWQQIKVRLKRQRKIEFLTNLLNDLNIEFKLTISNGVYEFSFYHELKDKIGTATTKKLCVDYITSSTDYLQGIYDGYMQGDGSKKHKQYCFASSSVTLFNDICFLSSVLGYQPFVNKPKHFNNPNHSVNYRGIISSRIRANTRLAEFYELPYNGKVYCVTVPTGMVLVRRNGVQIVSGNSPFAHTAITLRLKAPIAIHAQMMKHTVGFAHNTQCFDEQTQVLTDSGWKYWAELTENDLLAVPSLDFQTYTFEKPKQLFVYDYKGVMLHCYSRDLDMLCTPNHEQPISYYCQRGGQYWTPYTKMQTKDITGLRFPKLPPLPKLYTEQSGGYDLGYVQGVFLGDGSLSRDGKRIYFHVKKERKKEMLYELMERTPELDWVENPQADGYSDFRCYNKYGFVEGVIDKSIDWLMCSNEYYQGLFDGLIATGGSKFNNGQTSYSTVSKQLWQDFLLLCQYIGRETTTHIRDNVPNWNTAYRVRVKQNKPKLLKNIDEVYYDGKVYCAETSTNLLYVRRNGKANVSGNSRRYVSDTPELFVPTFRHAPENNVKQGSGEEVKKIHYVEYYGHRSEGKPRYFKVLSDDHNEREKQLYGVRGYDDVFNSVATQTSLQVDFTIIADKCLKFYEHLIELGVAPEQARFVLPQGVLTEWVSTGSLYAWARFYNLRTDPHAQKEIQDLAKMVGEIIEPLYPHSWKALTR